MFESSRPIRGDEKLIIFVKAPRSGCVKTRLAQAIGETAGLAAYRFLVERLLQNFESISNLELRFSPDDAFAEIRSWLRERWDARPQGTGDLGQRMRVAFTDAFASGAQRVVVIGSDCPDVTAAHISAAWSALATNDLVLGPARDGGYWLIGLRQNQSLLFQEICWSTAGVFAQTMQRAQDARLRVHLLPELNDIDTVADWNEFQQRNRA